MTEVFLPYEHGINEESGLLEYIDAGQTPPILLDVLTARFPSRLNLPDYGQEVDILIRDLRFLSREKKSSLNLNSSEFDSLTRHVRLKSNSSTILKVVRQKVMAFNHDKHKKSLEHYHQESNASSSSFLPNPQINGHVSLDELNDGSKVNNTVASESLQSSSSGPSKKSKKKQTAANPSSPNKKTKEVDSLSRLIEEEEAMDQIESQVIFNSAPPLCLDPSPVVHLIENKLSLSSRLVSSSESIQKLSRKILLNERRMLKKRQKILNRRQSFTTSSSSSTVTSSGPGHNHQMESMESAMASEAEEEERLFIASNPSLKLHSFLFHRKKRPEAASLRASQSIPFSQRDIPTSLSFPSSSSLVVSSSQSSLPSSSSLLSAPSVPSSSSQEQPLQSVQVQQQPVIDVNRVSEDVAKLSSKLKAITAMMNNRSIHDTSMTKVEEYLMEFETPGSHLMNLSSSSINPSNHCHPTTGGGVTCVSIFHRPLDDVFFGQLFVDRSPAKVFENGQINLKETLASSSGSRSSTFLLGSRESAKRYLEQFKEILTENGRKSVRITRTNASAIIPSTSTQQQHQPQQQQQQQQQQQHHQQQQQSIAVHSIPVENTPRVPVSNMNQIEATVVTKTVSPLVQALNQQPQPIHPQLIQQQMHHNSSLHLQQQAIQMKQQQIPNVQVIQPQGAKVILPSTVQSIHQQQHQTGHPSQSQQTITHQITSTAGNIIHIQSQPQIHAQQQHPIQLQTQSLLQQQQPKIQLQNHQQQLQHNPSTGIPTGQPVQIQQTPTGMICTMLNSNTLQAVLQQQQQHPSQSPSQGFNPQQQQPQGQQHVIHTIQPRQIVNHQQQHQHPILPQPNVQQRIQTDNTGQPQAVQFTQINPSQLRSIQGGHSFLLVNSSGTHQAVASTCQPMTGQANTGQVAQVASVSSGAGSGQSFRPLQVILWPQHQPPAAPAQNILQQSNQSAVPVGSAVSNTVVSSTGGSILSVNQHQLQTTGNPIAIANINLSNLTAISSNSNTSTTVTNAVVHQQLPHQATHSTPQT